ncbi:hypothetical protein R6Q59_028316 [Mikania micrantha]
MGKKAIGKKAPAKRWTDEEEVALAKSWLTISENPDVGNAQKRDGFIEKKWNGFYQQASMNCKSGEADGHVLKKAMSDYKSVVKSKGFPHMQAWELVRYNFLWCDILPADKKGKKICCILLVTGGLNSTNDGIQLIQQRGIPTKNSPSRRKIACFARGERRTHLVNATTTTSLR